MARRRCLSFPRSEGAPAPCRYLYWIPGLLEIVPAALASMVTLEYALDVESRETHDLDDDDSASIIRFIGRPSPELMLVSCLVLGLSVSSFAYRRQEHDPAQVMVLLLLLVGAVTAGYGAGAGANLILLGYVPWATCAAMVISYSGHSLMRRHRLRGGERRHEFEKGQPMD